MGSLDRQRWDALWQRLGGNPPADAFDALLAAYGGADRHYHSDRHILACLEHFDRWRQLARRPDLVELALWTHDLVYDRRCTTANRCGSAGRPPPAPTCAVPWSAWNSRPEPHGKISSHRLTRLSPCLRLRQQEGTARTGSSPLHPPKEEIS